MITAKVAKDISLKCKFTYLESLIKNEANKGKRSVSLLHEGIHLSDDEIIQLTKFGYNVHKGQSGKHGSFDIISW